MVFSPTIKRLMVLLLVNGLVPFLVFKVLRMAHFSEITALAFAALVPLLKVTANWVRERQLDVVGALVVLEILLSIGLAFAFHNPLLILLKNAIQAGVLGLVCLASLATRGSLAQAILRLLSKHALSFGSVKVDEDLHGQVSAACWRRVTLVWGCSWVVDGIARMGLVYSVRPEQYLLISPMIQVAFYAGLGFWTMGYVRAWKHRNGSNPFLPASDNL